MSILLAMGSHFLIPGILSMVILPSEMAFLYLLPSLVATEYESMHNFASKGDRRTIFGIKIDISMRQ